ncbi:hypothetical protein ABZS68_36255 [Streptomyces sp. NPDC005571]|uniref:hypothetical protein n=1 Tax=Streptomyces sp. NPDC005571 TaxID=3156888 RepID=UPI00339FAFB7
MQFTVLPFRTRPDSPNPGEAFLVRDNWDDYRFKTTFYLLYADEGGEVRELGSVKIDRFGMSAPATTSVPEDFETLDDAFFSLGQDDAYYEGLRELGADVQQTAAFARREPTVLLPANDPFAEVRLAEGVTLSD